MHGYALGWWGALGKLSTEEVERMVQAFRGVEALERAGIAEDMWRIRHQTFIEEQKWPLPSRNGMERDCYDDDGAIYLVSFDQQGKIKGGARLLQTTTPFLLEEVFPHLVQDPALLPKGPTVVEFTRYFIRSDLTRSREVLRTAGEIFCSIFEYCLDEGIDTMLAVVDMRIMPQAYEMGWQPKCLGLPAFFGGGPDAVGGGSATGIRVDITEEALRSTAHRRRVSLPALTDRPLPYLPPSPDISIN